MSKIVTAESRTPPRYTMPKDAQNGFLARRETPRKALPRDPKLGFPMRIAATKGGYVLLD